MLYFLAELLESFVLVVNRCSGVTSTDRSSMPLNSSTLRHMADYIGQVQRGCESEHFTTADARHSQTAILRIADSLSRQLPVYMLPTYLIAISKIPMTAQAKIDKRVLQATFSNLRGAKLTQYAPGQINMNGANVGSSSEATPLSAWEEDVAKALAHILELEVEQIHPATSFFNLGLDSVSAIRFCRRLRQLNTADFTVAEVLKNSTITRLGAVRASHAASPKMNESPPNNPQDVFTERQRSSIVTKIIGHGFEVEKIAPCTPLQEAMLSSSAPAGAPPPRSGWPGRRPRSPRRGPRRGTGPTRGRAPRWCGGPRRCGRGRA